MAKSKNVEMSLEEKLQKALVPIEEQPYKIPDNWVWTRLGEVCEIKGGKRIPKGEEFSEAKTKNAYLRVSDFHNYSINQEKIKYISDNIAEKIKNYRISIEDIYLSIAGTIGKVGIIPKELDKSFLTENAVKLTNLSRLINNKFLLNCFKTNFIQNLINDSITSSGQPKLAIFRIENFSIPLPPLNEQKRIVEKLDFLFDKTKKAKEIIEEIKIDIENRKISILDRAFKGILTSKWRNENKTSDVKELLKIINQEKIKKWEEECIQAEKEGKKKPKKPTITEVEDMIVPVDEQPYKLPDSWVWVRLGDVSEKISKGTTPRGEDGYTEKGISFLRVENIDENNLINSSKVKYISQETHNGFLKRSILKEKDILISIAGTLGKTAIVKKEDLPANINQAISFVRLIDNSKILEKFIVFYLNSPTVKDSLSSQVKVTAIPNLTLEIISDIKFPLPPLEEQQEIVRILDEVLENENKVKELLELEERIDILEKSILHKAFKGELGTQNNDDVPAMELLKEII